MMLHYHYRNKNFYTLLILENQFGTKNDYHTNLNGFTVAYSAYPKFLNQFNFVFCIPIPINFV